MYYGFIVDLLPTLFQTAGLGNYTLDFYTGPNQGGEKLPNGTWTGKVLLPYPVPGTLAQLTYINTGI